MKVLFSGKILTNEQRNALHHQSLSHRILSTLTSEEINVFEENDFIQKSRILVYFHRCDTNHGA